MFLSGAAACSGCCRLLLTQVTRDPRFDDLSGSLNVDLFKKSYSFIKDKRNDELQAVKDGAMRPASRGSPCVSSEWLAVVDA